jgi:molybdopterin-guanine dinucleotide biosynthesis protein A
MINRIDGVVLAGGRGRRMGGEDKGLLDWRGQPMVAWVAQVMRPYVNSLWISANRNMESYAAYADAVVADALPNFSGPLSGLHAVAEQSQADWLLTAPCDMPLLRATVFARLLHAARHADGSLHSVVAQSEDQTQPALALLPRAACMQIPQHIRAGRRRWANFVLAQKPRLVVFPAEWAPQFENLNSPEDQQRLHARAID